MAGIFIFIGIGISNNYYLNKYGGGKDKDEDDQNLGIVATFWNNSWAYFTAFIFMPILIVFLYLI